VDGNTSDLLVSVALLSESSLEKFQLTDAIRAVKRPDGIHQWKNTADILASGDVNRNLREFTVNFGVRRARRCKTNVAIKRGNKVDVSWPERLRRPQKLPFSASPTPPASTHEAK